MLTVSNVAVKQIDFSHPTKKILKETDDLFDILFLPNESLLKMKNHSPKAPTIHNSFDNNGSNVRVKIIANLHGNVYNPIVTIIHQNSVYKLRCDLGWGDVDSSRCSFNQIFKIHLKDATWKQKIRKNTSYHCGHKMNFIPQLQVQVKQSSWKWELWTHHPLWSALLRTQQWKDDDRCKYRVRTKWQRLHKLQRWVINVEPGNREKLVVRQKPACWWTTTNTQRQPILNILKHSNYDSLANVIYTFPRLFTLYWNKHCAVDLLLSDRETLVSPPSSHPRNSSVQIATIWTTEGTSQSVWTHCKLTDPIPNPVLQTTHVFIY